MADDEDQKFKNTVTEDQEIHHLTEEIADSSESDDINYQDLMQRQGISMTNYDRVLEALQSREIKVEVDDGYEADATTDKIFKCPECDTAFAMKHHLNEHMKIHTGLRPYKCQLCSAAFVRRYALTRHQLSHTKIKPHKCSFCSASFAFKQGLKQHELRHTGVKEFKCEVCSMAFARKYTLDRHRNVHIKKYRVRPKKF